MKKQEWIQYFNFLILHHNALPTANPDFVKIKASIRAVFRDGATTTMFLHTFTRTEIDEFVKQFDVRPKI